MEMAFVDNKGVRIRYEVEGRGDTIVLQHGFSDSLETWQEYGYVDALAPTHQVVIIDARGHGQSDKPHDPDSYALPTLTSDVVAVLDTVGVDRAHFFGLSMGGRYALGMAKYAPARLRSLMVGAVSPWRNLERGAAFLSFLAQGAEAFVPVWEAQAPISEALKARLRANDVKALMANQQRRMEHDDDILDALDGLSGPYRLIAGDQDNLAPYAEIVKFARGLPEGALITLPGINHLESMQRIDLVLPHLTALMQQV
jgi:pimeloyl-ACP methyl ester carboxylesterase